MLIDAHHHLWEYKDHDYPWMSGAMGSLRKNFLIPELRKEMREGGVEGTVAVQARQTIEETEWLLDLAGRYSYIYGVVGWVPLVDPDVGRSIERLIPNSKLKAVRHVLHDEPDDLYMLRDDFNRGIDRLLDYRLVYDILIFERHLPQTLTFVDRHPNQIFVVDHIAKPRIRERLLSPWKEQIRQLAQRDNVFCKVSGMATEADWAGWTAADLRPYFDIVLAAFGPRRLMFGSDWPVLTLAGSYNDWLTTFQSFIAALSPNEQEHICRRSAIASYRLNDA